MTLEHNNSSIPNFVTIKGEKTTVKELMLRSFGVLNFICFKNAKQS